MKGKTALTQEEKKEKEKENSDHILEHKYNPKYELLSEEQIKDLLEGLNITLNNLPKILVNDPICKLFNAKYNDVFKITRQSYTAGEIIFYRVVIDG